MITDIQLSTLVLIAALIWGILLILKGTSLTIDFFEPFSNVTGFLVIILAFFDKWAWRWKIFRPWLVSTPYIQGTWKGQLTTNWVDPNAPQNNKPIETYLVVTQKFSKVYARLLTVESSSELLSGEIVKNPDETWHLVGTYRNTPKILIRERSPIHYGGVILQIKDDPPIGLEGHYWTDRETKGELNFFGYNKKRFDNYTSASSKALYSKRFIDRE